MYSFFRQLGCHRHDPFEVAYVLMIFNVVDERFRRNDKLLLLILLFFIINTDIWVQEFWKLQIT